MNARSVLLLTALLVSAWLAIFGDKTPNSAVAEPTDPTRPQKSIAAPQLETSSSTPNSKNKKPSEPAIFVLEHRMTPLKASTSTSASQSVAIFETQTWTPPPPVIRPSKPVPPPPPIAPPLPFTFLGKKVEDGQYEVYLGRGTQTLIIREKMIIDGIYRVDAINPPTLLFTYLPLNQVQIMPIGGND